MSDFPDRFSISDEPAKKTARATPVAGKRLFDVCVALVLLPVLVGFAVALVVLNPFVNAGPLFFVQERMGRGCRPFHALKFRTMSVVNASSRGAFDPVEAERITPFGRALRRLRIDELPQILNVLRGEMSMIGPRPDAIAHARTYLQQVPFYADRYAIRPGISGYAQTEIGYVEGMAALRRKVAADLYYLDHASWRLDLWIVWRTLAVILGREGR